MSKKPNLNSINRFRFLKNNDQRQQMIEQAPENPLPSSFPVNELSKALHPDQQHVIISDIKV